MVVDISHIIDTGIGVILGGLITLEVNLYLQKMERKTQYAINNMQQIYEPLFDEIRQKKMSFVIFKTHLMLLQP